MGKVGVFVNCYNPEYVMQIEQIFGLQTADSVMHLKYSQLLPEIDRYRILVILTTSLGRRTQGNLDVKLLLRII